MFSSFELTIISFNTLHAGTNVAKVYSKYLTTDIVSQRFRSDKKNHKDSMRSGKFNGSPLREGYVPLPTDLGNVYRKHVHNFGKLLTQ